MRSAWLLAVLLAVGCAGQTKLTELQRVRSGDVDVVVLSQHEALSHGNDTFTIEFRSISDGALVDVADVRASATMPMPGAPMFGSIDVKPSATQGRYAAAARFEMAGTWRMTIEWRTQRGPGSVTFAGTVQ